MAGIGRKPRNYYKYGIYHVVQRGNNKAFIFDDQLDKANFCKIVMDVKQTMPFHLIYYVLMDNHYHFIIEMLDINISVIMKQINMVYSKYYNHKYGRTGTIFGNRYNVFPVVDTRYLIKLIEYIAHNPVKAKIVRLASEYKWSGHTDVVTNHQRLVDVKRLFDLLDESRTRAKEIYMSLVECHLELPMQTHLEVQEVQKLIQIERRKESIEVTLMYFLDGDEAKFKLLRVKEKAPERTDMRRRCAKHAVEHGFTTKEIAQVFGISQRAVRNYLS